VTEDNCCQVRATSTTDEIHTGNTSVVVHDIVDFTVGDVIAVRADVVTRERKTIILVIPFGGGGLTGEGNITVDSSFRNAYPIGATVTLSKTPRMLLSGWTDADDDQRERSFLDVLGDHFVVLVILGGGGAAAVLAYQYKMELDTEAQVVRQVLKNAIEAKDIDKSENAIKKGKTWKSQGYHLGRMPEHAREFSVHRAAYVALLSYRQWKVEQGAHGCVPSANPRSISRG